MNITSATFVKGVVGIDKVLEAGVPQIAFIGRSNVGKSSTINAICNNKNLVKSSSHPGKTQEINVFLINKNIHLMDLPGYGYAKASFTGREALEKLIYGYLLDSHYQQRKIILIIDAFVGPTKDDLAMLRALGEHGKSVVIVANKIDQVKKSELAIQIEKIQKKVGHHILIPFSAEKKIGVQELVNEVLSA